MSVDREDLLAVNGFDEDFLGWGGEDIDLVNRLKLKGLTAEGNVGRAVIYHLEHPIREPHDGDEQLAKRKDKVLDAYFVTNGIQKITEVDK